MASNLLKSSAVAALLAAAAFHFFVGSHVIHGYYRYFTHPKNVAGQECISSKCWDPTLSCLGDMACLKTLACVMHCGATVEEEAEAACAYLCEMTHGYENQAFLDLIICMVNSECLARYPQDGICHADDSHGVETIDSLSKIAGDWWVINGLNCGQDRNYPGGYDWYPCQHERFIYLEDQDQWINNVTYCGGKDSVCNTDMIVTVANVSLPSPGVVRHDYTDAPLAPQQESWRIVSWPDQGDYLLMLWCGRLPVLDYNGGIVLSRKRSDKEMPETVKNELRRVAKKFGLDYDSFCPSDNTECPF